MPITTLQEILSEWQSNIAFREEFKINPERALMKAGFEVSAEDLAKIKAMLTGKNEKLDDRINK